MKEIVPRHNFTIVVDNENCGQNNRQIAIATCTHSMTVYYKTYEIVLTQERFPKTVNMVIRRILILRSLSLLAQISDPYA